MELYTDGSCIVGADNVKYAGAGIWFGQDDVRNAHIPIACEYSTNQCAELLAIKYSLIFCKGIHSIIIKTDSKYSINCLTVWYKTWDLNGWKTSTGKDVMHSFVIRECISMIQHRESQGYHTSIEYVKGHSKVVGNDGADALAREGSTKSYKRAMDNTIFFSTGILSQFWPTSFTSGDNDGNIEYNCAEQWHHHRKALLFQDHDSTKKILESSSPYEQKTLGRRVSGYDDGIWKLECLDIAVRGNYYKFSQNNSIKNYLLSTKGKRLVEAREDKVWGIGITTSMARNGIRWNGLNLLGKALMIVRDEML